MTTFVKWVVLNITASLTDITGFALDKTRLVPKHNWNCQQCDKNFTTCKLICPKEDWICS